VVGWAPLSLHVLGAALAKRQGEDSKMVGEPNWLAILTPFSHDKRISPLINYNYPTYKVFP